MINFIKKLRQRYNEIREKKLFPERQYIVEVTEDKVSCKMPSGITEEVTWEELNKIEVHTTNQGPFVEDVFFVLYGNDRGCVIPQGGTNTEMLVNKILSLPDVNNEKFVEAMSCTSNMRFLVWERQ